MSFGGSTLTQRDIPRLSGQLGNVYEIMSDGAYRTLDQIVTEIKGRFGKVVTSQSVSARLRDLRKTKFGGYKVLRESVGAGLFKYGVFRQDGTTLKAAA